MVQLNTQKLPQRNEPGSFYVGKDFHEANSALISLDRDGLLAIKRKSVWKIQLPDNIDPQRNNAQIPKQVQSQLFSYGSDHEIIGRTLLQGNELLVANHLPKEIDIQRGMRYVIDFTKELIAFHDAILEMNAEYIKIQNEFTADTREDGSLLLQDIKYLDRKGKEFIQNIDHIKNEIFNIVELFPLNFKKENFIKRLKELSVQKFQNNHPLVKRLNQIKEKTDHLWKLRTAIEHPKESGGEIIFKNFQMNDRGQIEFPHLLHTAINSPFAKMDLLQFCIESQNDMVDLFELSLVLLCDFYAKDFGGDRVFVRSVLDNERSESNPHMNYKYDIHWK